MSTLGVAAASVSVAVGEAAAAGVTTTAGVETGANVGVHVAYSERTLASATCSSSSPGQPSLVLARILFFWIVQMRSNLAVHCQRADRGGEKTRGAMAGPRGLARRADTASRGEGTHRLDGQSGTSFAPRASAMSGREPMAHTTSMLVFGWSFANALSASPTQSLSPRSLSRPSAAR